MTRKAEAIPDAPDDVPAGALTIAYGGSRWQCACAHHAERPMRRYPFEELEPGEVAIIRAGKLAKLRASNAGADVHEDELAGVLLEMGDHPLRVLPVLDDDGRVPVLRHPDGVVLVPLAEVKLEDLVLSGEPIRRPNGEPLYTGEPAPGYQPDCLACSETVELLIDHMLRVDHDRKTAERFHAREMRRMARDLGIGA